MREISGWLDVKTGVKRFQYIMKAESKLLLDRYKKKKMSVSQSNSIKKNGAMKDVKN